MPPQAHMAVSLPMVMIHIDVKIKAQVNDCDIWDGPFLEIKYEKLKNKIIIGHI